VRERDMAAAMQSEMESRSVWWVVGTSLCFEALVLGAGVWYFRRRDF